MELKDLFIGKLDAKNEQIFNDYDKERFLRGFLLPENIYVDNFLQGNRCFIVGLKGTGKTALLKFIKLKAEDSLNAHTMFVLFKSDFTEEDKADFSKAAESITITKTNDDIKDYTDVWLWYFHRLIVNCILEKNLEGRIFKNDKNWEKYKSCVLATKIDKNESGLTRLLPKLKRGNVELSADTAILKGKLGLDFEWIDKERATVKFSSIVKQVNTLYKGLVVINNPEKLYLFFDELELSFNTTKQYNNDIKLIRDIIVAIYKLNESSNNKRFPIYAITSIRSEVLTAIEISGKEINKIIADFGTTLTWPQRGGDSSKHPLMNVITKKIKASYKQMGLECLSDDEIWDRYFPERIGDKSIYEFILNKTWYRPRDIIRLLSIAQNRFPNYESFSQFVLESINKDYSTECWKEQVEELRAIYNEEELSGIKTILLSIKCPFTFTELKLRCEEKREMYKTVDSLLSKHKLADILSNLYRIGVIGNTGQKMRFSFRGDDELIIENKMTIHQALWGCLSVERNLEYDRNFR